MRQLRRPKSHGASDAELIGRSIGGDEFAFVLMVRRHAPVVAAYLARRAGPGLVEDLLRILVYDLDRRPNQ